MKFCVDCKWLKTTASQYAPVYSCAHPSLAGSVDLVTGREKWMRPADDMRRSDCGEEGKLWEPRVLPASTAAARERSGWFGAWFNK